VLDLSSPHPVGADLVIDLKGQGFDTAVVAVFGPAGLTHSTIPSGIEGFYDLMRPDGVSEVLIPGSALGQVGGHFIGVAGVVKAGYADLDNVNTVLSSFGAAKMVFASVTVEQPDLELF